MKNKEERLVTLLNNLIGLYMDETIGTYDNLDDWYEDFCNEMDCTIEELESYGIDMEV